MKSYLNSPELKERFVTEVKRHQDADQIVQGTYGEETDGKWRGCAVGCAIDSLNVLNGTKLRTSDHALYESELGLPEWLARLEDTIFEGLPKDIAMQWPLRFAKAVPVGVDLQPLKWRFSAYLMRSNIERVLMLNISDELKEKVLGALRQVLSLHEAALSTGQWDESAAESAARSAWSAAESAESAAESAARSAARSAAESAAWSAARSAAESAAWSAARSAAESAAESAARSAAESAAWSAWSAWSAARSAGSAARSARSAARSAAESAAESARSAAESAEYIKHADKLIELLEQS